MNKIVFYLKESYKEIIEKVSWPKWDELQQSTILVLIATIFITLVVYVMDFAGSQALKMLYSILLPKK